MRTDLGKVDSDEEVARFEASGELQLSTYGFQRGKALWTSTAFP